jgi:hypothetical protein
MIRAELIKNKHKWYFYDLQNVFPRWNLSKVGELIGCKKLERPECVKEARRPRPDEMDYFLRYAMRDAEICYRAGKWLMRKYGTIKPTIASLAFYLLKRDYLRKGVMLCEKDTIKEKLRQAYRGGRCEALWRGTVFGRVRAYDVNSLYPYIMATREFPLVFGRLKHKSNINLDNEGVAKVKIIQEAELPPLGVKRRVEDGYVKLIFPAGTLVDWFTYPELRLLEDAGIGKILRVYEAYETPYRGKIFTHFVETLYRKRREEKHLNDWYKLILNSPYGKFGEKVENVMYYIDDEDLQRYTQTKFPKHCNPLIAAYITAYARLRLWRLMKRVGFDKVLYCDTDSVFTTGNGFTTSEELGGLKVETASNPLFIRAKCYVWGDEVAIKGSYGAFTPSEFKKLIAKGTVEQEVERWLRFREAMRRHLDPFSIVKCKKRFTIQPDGKRVYAKKVEGKDLLETCTDSIPLEVKED